MPLSGDRTVAPFQAGSGRRVGPERASALATAEDRVEDAPQEGLRLRASRSTLPTVLTVARIVRWRSRSRAAASFSRALRSRSAALRAASSSRARRLISRCCWAGVIVPRPSAVVGETWSRSWASAAAVAAAALAFVRRPVMISWALSRSTAAL